MKRWQIRSILAAGFVLVLAGIAWAASSQMRKDGDLVGRAELILRDTSDGTTPDYWPAAVTCTTSSNVALSVTSETVFSANANRKKASIYNRDTAITIYVSCGSTATSAWDPVGPGQQWYETVEGGYICKDAITALAASSTPAISSSECQD